ncbi:small, acid-soluble spore protein, alpha/beta type [Alicyclobacillus macrosporangiidus]|uniref:small, acid-soluble spore protein, alpha/beta type n=1 Tax=Alicyclobacillus macrosporangiidus TaxID=392015 RepID=UPI0026E9BCDA|nr:small, acid-soluble spore protein, alpha/beta type [Alicyclobacillus macrosporangiidus]
MARRRLLVPEAREALNQLKQQVIEQKRSEGALYADAMARALPLGPASQRREQSPARTAARVQTPGLTPGVSSAGRSQPVQGASHVTPGTGRDQANVPVPAYAGMPYRVGAADPGELTARQAGKLGGEIGGTMVQKLVQIAREELSKSPHLANPRQVRNLLGQHTGPERGR